jgi:hypothetical protein
VQPVPLRGTPFAVQALVGESLYITMGSADAKYGSIKELRGTIVGVQSLASGATTVLKRIFKRTASTIRPIKSRLLSAAATSILRL